MPGSRWVNRLSIVFWLIAAIVFLYSGLHNVEVGRNTKLARFSVATSEDIRVTAARIDLGKTFSDMAETNNRNVQALEDSVRDGAYRSATLNFVSFVGALLAFVAQLVGRNSTHGTGAR